MFTRLRSFLLFSTAMLIAPAAFGGPTIVNSDFGAVPIVCSIGYAYQAFGGDCIVHGQRRRQPHAGVHGTESGRPHSFPVRCEHFSDVDPGTLVIGTVGDGRSGMSRQIVSPVREL
jgi:hypothetical protein